MSDTHAMLAVQVPKGLAERLDRAVATAKSRQPIATVTRSDILRWVIEQGLADLERVFSGN